ncbi:TlpA family protein disulfide reductase [Sphingobium vermicomposti]|uniref:Thiol-disulfide isomerase/thioredoxin n=1 Tax=Sphingobium vermicomposti TaxID=529005 RepID=A0A846MB29_9SPHN|nr:TlpA disulfide reductase family protein [Sphingobium vermicomposti]NIJ17324.1 thiol-disulfide isomerase/thioredoxin [Sphingobium vermicomposti]
MTLLLLAGLGACDRQSPPSGQDQANSSAQVPPTSGEATGASQSTDGAFSYTLDRSKAGSAAPDFPFTGSDGKDMTLQDFAGKPVLVNLWATWCAPCVAEMPTLDAVAKAHGKQGLAVLTISQDSQGETVVKPFFAKHKLPHLKGWIDPENQFGFHYATGMLPTSVLYDRQGKEMVRVVGALDWNSQQGRDLIRAALES